MPIPRPARAVGAILLACTAVMTSTPGAPAATPPRREIPVFRESPVPVGVGAIIATAARGGVTWLAGFRQGSAGGTAEVPFVLRRDGGRWRSLALPSPGSGYERTNPVQAVAVTARGPARLWAVGQTALRSGRLPCDLDSRDAGPVLAAVHDGTRWRTTAVPVPDRTYYGGLIGVVAPSPRDAWAVGYVDIVDSAEPVDAGGVELCRVTQHREALVVHWDGGTWTAVEVPGRRTYLPHDVAVSRSGTVWTVGRTADHRPVAQAWDGRAWRRVPVPVGRGELVDLSVDARGGMWASGRSVSTAHPDGRAVVLRLTRGRWQRVRTPGWAPAANDVAFDRGMPIVIGNQDAPGARRPGAYAMARVGGTWRRIALPATTGRLALASVGTLGGRLLLVGNASDRDGVPRAVVLTERRARRQ